MSLSSKTLSFAVLIALAGSATAASSVSEQAKLRGLTQVHTNPAAVRAANGDKFNAVDAIVDANGGEHVRFKRTYAGLDVIGGDFVVHSRNGRLLSVSQTLNSKARPSMAANISADDAIIAAGTAFGTGFKGMPSASQVIFARNTTPKLAFEVVIDGPEGADQTPTEMHYFIDAQSGVVLDQWDMVHTAKPAQRRRWRYGGRRHRSHPDLRQRHPEHGVGERQLQPDRHHARWRGHL